MLITTNGFVPAVDQSDVRTVVLFDLPHFQINEGPKTYEPLGFIRNIGRAGRNGQSCAAFILVTADEVDLLRNWEVAFGITIQLFQ